MSSEFGGHDGSSRPDPPRDYSDIIRIGALMKAGLSRKEAEREVYGGTLKQLAGAFLAVCLVTGFAPVFWIIKTIIDIWNFAMMVLFGS